MTIPTFKIEDYEKLLASISTGALEVQFSDRKVVYRSLKEMLQVKKIMENSLGLGSKKSKNLYPTFSKGL